MNVARFSFLVAGHLGGCNEWDAVHGFAPERLMDATQVREWLAAGHEIGSHSLTHRNLTRLDEAAAREQIIASKQRLEDTFGVPVRHFCYPHGKWNERLRDLVAQAGYATACTTKFGVNTAATPRHALLRIQPLGTSELLGKVMHRLSRHFFSLKEKPE
jgi:peptidoglycan/xylan/chitin deacetylase (PgdA/CDA1 family)